MCCVVSWLLNMLSSSLVMIMVLFSYWVGIRCLLSSMVVDIKFIIGISSVSGVIWLVVYCVSRWF